MMAMGPGVDFASSSGIFVFIGNLLFLQTIAAPTFGTNVPLWSLANEFWYYFMVPIAWLALAGRSKITVRAAALVIAIIAIALFPLPLVILGLIWVFGTATYRLKSWIAKLRPVPFLVYGGCAVAAIAAAFLLALDLYRFCAGRLRA